MHTKNSYRPTDISLNSSVIENMSNNNRNSVLEGKTEGPVSSVPEPHPHPPLANLFLIIGVGC